MKRPFLRFFAVSGLLALLATVPALPGFAAEVVPAEKIPVGWREFEIPAGRFKILVPAPPKTIQRTVRTDIGNVASTRYTTTGSGDVTYDILLNDYPKDGVARAHPLKLLEGARDGLMYQTKGRMISDKSITLGGYPGRDLEIMGPEDVHYRARLVWAGTRLYQILVVTPGKPRPEGDAFINSFQITGRP